MLWKIATFRLTFDYCFRRVGQTGVSLERLTPSSKRTSPEVWQHCVWALFFFAFHSPPSWTYISQEWVEWAEDLLLEWGTPWVESWYWQLFGLMTMGDFPCLISVFLIPKEKSYWWKILNIRPGSQDRPTPQACPDWRALLTPSCRPPCVEIPCAHTQHWTCPWSS